MMGHKAKLDGEGFDAFTRWRHLLRWRSKAARIHARRETHA